MAGTLMLGAGVCFFRNPSDLISLIAFFIFPLLLVSRRGFSLLRLTAVGVLPVAVGLYSAALLVHINNPTATPPVTFDSASMLLLKLTASISLFLFAFGGSARDVEDSLRGLGISEARLMIITSSLALLSEIKKRADQVVAARYARGLVAKRNLLNSLLSLPFILRTLFAWSIMNGISRSEVWKRENLLTRAHEYRMQQTRFQPARLAPTDYLYLTASILWLTYGIFAFSRL